MSRDPYDSYVNQWLYSYWDYSECQNGNLCTHPFCPDHEVRDFWDSNDWPSLMSRSDEMRSIEEGTAEQWLR